MKMTDFPCLYRFADADRSIQCDFFCGLSSIFDLKDSEVLAHSDLFAHTSQSVLFNGTGLSMEELESFGRKRLDKPFADCKTLSSAFSDYDLKNEACQICHLSPNFKNAWQKDEQILLSFILHKGKGYEELLDDLQEKNFCSVCYLVPGKSLRSYPLIQFNRALLSYIKSLDDYDTLSREELVNGFAPYLHDIVRNAQKKKKIVDATIPSPVNISFHDIAKCVEREISILYDIRQEALTEAQLTKCRARNRGAGKYVHTPPIIRKGKTDDAPAAAKAMDSIDNTGRKKRNRYKSTSAGGVDFQISIFDMSTPDTSSSTSAVVLPDFLYLDAKNGKTELRNKSNEARVASELQVTDVVADESSSLAEVNVASDFHGKEEFTGSSVSAEASKPIAENISSETNYPESNSGRTVVESEKISVENSESVSHIISEERAEESLSEEPIAQNVADEDSVVVSNTASSESEEVEFGAFIVNADENLPENFIDVSAAMSSAVCGSETIKSDIIMPETDVVIFASSRNTAQSNEIIDSPADMASDTSIDMSPLDGIIAEVSVETGESVSDYDTEYFDSEQSDDIVATLPALEEDELFNLVTESNVAYNDVSMSEEVLEETVSDVVVSASELVYSAPVPDEPQVCIGSGICKDCLHGKPCTCVTLSEKKTDTENSTVFGIDNSTENSTENSTVDSTDNDTEATVLSAYERIVEEFRKPDYETCFMRSSCGLLYPLYNLTDSFFKDIVDCSIDDIRNIHHFLSDSCSSTTICVDAVRYHMRSGLLFYMECSRKFYFFDIDFTYSNFLQPILGTASKVKYLSINSIPVYFMLAKLGFKHVYIDMLPNLFSRAHNLECNISFSELFHLVLGVEKGRDEDFYQFVMPHYKALYDVLNKRISAMDDSILVLERYKSMNGFNRALSSAYDLSDVVLDLQYGVDGMNQHDYFLYYDKNMQIISSGTMYIVQFSVHKKPSQDTMYKLFHDIISSVYLLPYNCLVHARLLSVSPSSIAFFCTSDGDEFFDILLDQARRMYEDMFQQIPIIDTQRIIF